jgi:hypothetical protein
LLKESVVRNIPVQPSQHKSHVGTLDKPIFQAVVVFLSVVHNIECIFLDTMMRKTTKTKYKILYILSDDFGEIAVVNMFIPKVPYDVLQVYSEKMYEYQDAPATIKKRCRSLKSVKKIIEEFKPQIVIMSSGYQFAILGMYPNSEIRKLVSYIQNKNIKIITTDPWMKIFSLYPKLTFSNIKLINSVPELYRPVIHKRFTQINILHAQASEIFKNIPHIYAFPVSLPNCYSFFNVNAHVNNEEIYLKRASPLFQYDVENSWLFILSAVDYAMQWSLYGRGIFHCFEKRLSEILNEKKNKVVVIAPENYKAHLKNKFKGNGSISVISFCKFTLYQSILLTAKVVFYWNVFSASVIQRIATKKPVLFFSKGHMCDVCPGLYEHGLRYWYQGIEPTFMDVTKPLPDDLQQDLFEKEKNNLQKICEQWERQPSPESVTEKIMSAVM